MIDPKRRDHVDHSPFRHGDLSTAGVADLDVYKGDILSESVETPITIEVRGLEELVKQKILELEPKQLKTPANCSMRQVATLKGVVSGTLKASEYLQPWAGFSYREGTKKYWPFDAVEEWLSVFDHNRIEYFQRLLKHENQEISKGVKAQLVILRNKGKLPEKYHICLEEKL